MVYRRRDTLASGDLITFAGRRAVHGLEPQLGFALKVWFIKRLLLCSARPRD
jgi:hypothetical protein